MEPTKAEVRFVIYTNVGKVTKNPAGYFVHFIGSWESIFLGVEDPGLQVGEKVKITFERVDPCPPK